MSKLKIKDFDGLNVGPFSKKVSEVNDIDFLTELEDYESENGNRKGVLDAINKRQGELLGPVEVLAEEVKADAEGEKEPLPLGEVDMEEFKRNIEGNSNMNALKKILEIVKKSDHPEMEQIVIERLAEVQKAAETPEGPGNSNPPKEDEGLTGKIENVRPATDEEQAAWLKEQLVDALKDKRLHLDKMAVKIQHHMGIDSTPEKSIGLAKAWLGVCLGELNEDSPYKDESKIKDRSQIPAPADRDISNAFKAECVRFNNINTEFAVIGLREDLLKVIKFLQDLTGYDMSREFAIARTQAYINAREARFALGVILGSLKV